MSKFDKVCAKIRARLVKAYGEGCAVSAFDLGYKYHTGTRRDGVTPEFAHPLLVGTNLYNIRKWLIYPEETIATGFIHDTPEDYREVTRSLIENLCGKMVAESTLRLNKRENGKLIPKQIHFAGIAEDPCSSVVKPADTYNNFETIDLVFDPKKQIRYIRNTARHLLPAIVKAKHKFHEQVEAYRLYEYLLKRDIVLFSRILDIKSPVLNETQRMF